MTEARVEIQAAVIITMEAAAIHPIIRMQARAAEIPETELL